MYSIYRQFVAVGGGVGGGGVELCCRPYSAGLLHSVSDQIQNPQNCFTTPNIKITTKDDIKGFVSLKFLCPGWSTNTEHCRINCLLQSTIAQLLISFSSYSKNHAFQVWSAPVLCYSLLLSGSTLQKRASPLYAYFYLPSSVLSVSQHAVTCIFLLCLDVLAKKGFGNVVLN